MRRAIRFAVLALLLLSLQHQGYVHPIAHLAGFAPHSQETALSIPQLSADCVECALLAGGLNAVHGDLAATNPVAPVVGPLQLAYQSRAAEVPAWFRSRAPPVLL
jgi:hypothetical protein